MKGLTADEIAVLESFEKLEAANGADLARSPSFPPRLMEFGYIAWDLNDSRCHITKAGERALFHIRCVDALRALLNGVPQCVDKSVASWLEKNGFATLTHAAPGMEITKRGRLWLALLDDATQAPPPTPMPEDFARRRGQ